MSGLVEQWSEEPCVAGSSPALGTDSDTKPTLHLTRRAPTFPSGNKGGGELRLHARKREIGLETLLEGFLLKMRSEGRTEQTVEWYENRIRRFLAVWARGVPAEGDVRRFLIALKQRTRWTAEGTRGVSDRYVEQHRKALGRFFSWAKEAGLVKENPCRAIAPYKGEEKDLMVLSEQEFRALLETQDRKTFYGVRNRTMLCLMYDTGIRVGELVKLERSMINLNDGVAVVPSSAKSRKERRVPLSRLMKHLLWEYQTQWRPEIALNGRLFTSFEGEALAETSVNQWMRRAGREAGVNGKRISPHTLRHTFGTMYIRNGGDVFTLQKIMGHRSVKTTMVYVHMANSDVETRHAVASPLSALAG